MTEKWKQRFLEQARIVGSWSKDPSTQVGCIVVDEDKNILSMGFNGFPRGIEDTDERYQNRDLKYKMVCHAEANAVAAAARNGHSLKGGILFSTAMPCCQCTVLIIQSGIQMVNFTTNLKYEQRWIEDLKIAWKMLEEAKVEVHRFL